MTGNCAWNCSSGSCQVTLFFFAYSHGTDDPVRFILTAFPALCLAVAASGIWKNFRLPDDAAGTAAVIAGWFVAPSNLSARETGVFTWRNRYG